MTGTANNFSRARPSSRYRELMEQYCRLHTEGEKFLGIPPERVFPGESLLAHASRVKRLVDLTGARWLLDYGSGKGVQYGPVRVREADGREWPSILAYWGVESVRCYDPCYAPFSALPEGRFDGVISTDVLEHCPEEDMPWILKEIFGYATRFVFVNVACYPAVKRLPSGENAHCTIKSPEWWQEAVASAAARHPDIVWELWVQQRLEGRLVDARLGNSPV
jgi:hypothetical protein